MVVFTLVSSFKLEIMQILSYSLQKKNPCEVIKENVPLVFIQLLHFFFPLPFHWLDVVAVDSEQSVAKRGVAGGRHIPKRSSESGMY